MLSLNERSVQCPGVNRRITEFAVKKLVLNPTEIRQTDETEKDKIELGYEPMLTRENISL
jgi:hypothetical protein